MRDEFNGMPIDYGQRFTMLPEMDIVTQYNWTSRYAFYMEESSQLGTTAAPVAVWRIQSPKK